MMKHPEVFIFEGGDGTGKATQSILLAKYLNDHLRSEVTYFSFPVYEFPMGRVIGNSVLGRWGQRSGPALSPDEAAHLYALNRLEVLPYLERALSRKEIVFCNRGPYANAFSVAKKLIEKNLDWQQLSSPEKGERVDEILSYDHQFLDAVSTAGLANIFFTLDPQESMLLAQERTARFLGQKPDEYERDSRLQSQVAAIFSDLGSNKVKGHQGVLIEVTRTLLPQSRIRRLKIDGDILEKYGGILETAFRLISQIQQQIDMKGESPKRYLEIICQYLPQVVGKGEESGKNLEFRTKDPVPPPDLWKTNPKLFEEISKNQPKIIEAIQASNDLDLRRGLIQNF